MKHAGGDVPGFDRTCKQSILNILLWFLFPRGLSGGLLLLVLLAVSFFGVVTTNAETVAPSNSLALIGSSAPTEYRLYLPSVRLTIPPISSPVMKWQHAGCYSSWCETGWYSSPAVADLEGDGSIEVIGSTYTIFVFDGPTGNLEWRVKSGHDRSENPDSVSNVGRTWAGIVVTDVDNDNQLELVTAHHEGYVSIYNHNGYFESGWPKRLTPGWEMRSLAVGDVDGNGDREILVCSTRSNDQWFMLEHTGATRSGWPVHSTSTGIIEMRWWAPTTPTTLSPSTITQHPFEQVLFTAQLEVRISPGLELVSMLNMPSIFVGGQIVGLIIVPTSPVQHQ
jgi:hypothetical protein